MNRNVAVWPWFIVITILVVQVFAHLSILHPSTHSGQIAIPWMINQGRELFDTVIEQHAPGGSLLVAFFQRLLPLNPLYTVKVLNLLFVLSAGFIIFILASLLEGQKVGILALLFWAVWEPVYNNIMFYYDALVGISLVLAVLVWFMLQKRFYQHLSPFVTGMILGGATLLKQHAWMGVFLFGLWLVVVYWNRGAYRFILTLIAS